MHLGKENFFEKCNVFMNDLEVAQEVKCLVQSCELECVENIWGDIELI